MLRIKQLRTINGLTENEKSIRDYILDHLSKIPTITIQELAAASYTSHSAIIRFAKKLGFSGFRDLRYQLSEEIQRDALMVHDVDANFPFTQKDGTMVIAKKMADLTTIAVSRTLTQLTDKSLKQASDLLIESKRIYFFANGDSQIRARSFQNKLVKIGRLVVIAEEYNDEAWTAAAIRPQDCAVFLSYGGNSDLHMRYLKMLSKKHVPTLVITGNPYSDELKWAKVSLIAAQMENGNVLKVSTFSSQIAFDYILNILFSIMYVHDYQNNLIHMRTTFQNMNE